MIYIMSDIHGMYDKYIQMLKQIDLKDEDILIIIGDVIDRGEKSIPILQDIMSKHNVVMLIGNHENMMLGYYGYDNCPYNWFYNGGQKTYNELNNLPEYEQIKILEYLNKLPFYYIHGKYIISHSGFFSKGTDNIKKEFIHKFMNSQYKYSLLWERKEFYLNSALDGWISIFGHTPTIYMTGNKFKIWHDSIYNDKIGIDCGAVYGGYLACLRLDDMKEFYV
jgi:serine/threonine protein phosphatase 1